MSWTNPLTELVVRDGVIDERLIRAVEQTDRADFVPNDLRHEAYLDRPVPIPQRQTTSQPTLIARMLEACRIEPDHRVLEVGTGYGFQTALIARLAAEVYSVERFPELAEAAVENLAAAGIGNASVIVGDGWEGYPPAAPYDSIVVSAAASEVPQAFETQLREGGRLVIPVRGRRSDNVLVFVNSPEGLVQAMLLTPARFVPLVKGDDR